MPTSTLLPIPVAIVSGLGAGGDSTAQSIAFGICGIVVGAVGIAIAALQLRRTRRKVVFELA
jgi:hypothetical protein